ncbi:LacI family DNA-binding transcriptional regulator [Rhizobium terrae]|uniref:LacI family DNA-binding transcriptional regulator n=1 Tax=Rhizobium terrae TaxID=2171756 RepID=UPI0013C2CF2B|nr:LacI family DNA-binding transcriptional regulator [Rhizobium terrae]
MDNQHHGQDNGRDRRRGPTSRDVAQAAGVSQSTVSLIFSGKDAGRINPATREAVLSAAATLGYRLNASARALKLGTHRLLALAVPNAANPYFAAVLKAATAAARAKGYAVVLINVGDDPGDGERLLESLAAHTFDGLIVWENPWTPTAERFVPATVVADGLSPGDAAVFIPAGVIVRHAIEHLAGLGHQKIGRIGFDMTAIPFRSRAQAFREALSGHSLRFDPRFEFEEPFGATASDRLTALLSGPDRPSAFICDDDLLAPLAYRAASRLGLRIPDDLSLVGIGDIDLARLMEPDLTTVAIPPEVVGETLVEAALERIDLGSKPALRTIETRLVVRGSTAKTP